MMFIQWSEPLAWLFFGLWGAFLVAAVLYNLYIDWRARNGKK